jgi:hypothetical protein
MATGYPVRALVRGLLGLVLVAGGVLGMGGPAARPASAQAFGDMITIGADLPVQQPYAFQGFGTSLAWWANVVGGWNDFGRRFVDSALFGPFQENDVSLPRLGLNVVRYNIGASAVVPGSNPPAAALGAMPACDGFLAGAAVPVLAPNGQPKNVDLGRDANQIAILQDATASIQAAGRAPVLEAFANSAPYWMTVNGCSQGKGHFVGPFPAGENNLDSSQYQTYSTFLVEVLKRFRDEKGITFTTVDPFNEPDNPWLTGLRGNNQDQEGMHMDPAGQAGLIPVLCDQLNREGVGTFISASDGFNPDQTITDFGSYVDPHTRGCVAKLNTHMYDVQVSGLLPPHPDLVPYKGIRREELAQAADNAAVPFRTWVSEFGAGGGAADMSSALTVSAEIARDIRYQRARAWVYWQAVEKPGGWGLLQASNDWPQQGATAPDFTKRFYALEQYSHFIAPGSWILSVSDPNLTFESTGAETTSTLAAEDFRTGQVTIVGTNATSSPRAVTFDLHQLGVQINSVVAYRTTDTGSQGTGNVQPDTVSAIGTDSFSDSQPARSITTYVINGPAPGLPSAGGPPPNQPPVVSAGPDVAGDETSSITLNGSAADPDGDPLTLNWTWSPAPGTTDPGLTCTFADQHAAQTTITCSDEAAVRATLTADDGFNLPVSSSTTVTSTNLGPSIAISSPAPWQVASVPATVNLTAPVVDPGAHDSHTCRIDWDDGTVETFTQEGSCSRAHTYTRPGMFTIDVTVTDDDQHSASAQVIAIVVDPNAGFVTGGGWIDSPAGALTADATLTGRAHFTANPRYTDASTLDGKVAFGLKEAGLDLSSRTLDWLVVTPDGRFAVKGTADLSGTPVGFVFYGAQGCGSGSGSGCQPGPDRIRMLIWRLSDGPTPEGVNPIYDNVPGGSFELDDFLGQPLGGGNLQIHTSGA